MTVGMLLAATAFVCAALVQIQIDVSGKKLGIECQYKYFSQSSLQGHEVILTVLCVCCLFY